ncbi:hypothetical protein [Mesorhizobium sp. SP-1A]|uniref:hypothetical protein n=1 Tax=Mesorhizobium sp. SP-1A TaxID=3077840 RepID=UPI0028F6FFBA|nr:hypothetical protein [Mesorhizobium sp. SP-1A]
MKTIDLVRTLERYVAKNGTLVVGVCGHAGAGKSTLCREFIYLASIPTIRLNCDLFSTHGYRERQELIAVARATGDRNQIDAIENPRDWYAYNAIASAISDLKQTGRHSYKRAWNSETGDLDGTYDVSLPNQRPAIILCDGIYLLHPPIRQALDITIIVDTATDILDQRCIARSKGDIERAQQHRTMRERFAVPYFDQYGWLADIVIDDKAETSNL